MKTSKQRATPGEGRSSPGAPQLATIACADAALKWVARDPKTRHRSVEWVAGYPAHVPLQRVSAMAKNAVEY
ncbi:MAG: hypothetical protein KAX55_14985 [Propionivibrio sp.]|nr:hypothetical protein [Propionivibrio sp.]